MKWKRRKDKEKKEKDRLKSRRYHRRAPENCTCLSLGLNEKKTKSISHIKRIKRSSWDMKREGRPKNYSKNESNIKLVNHCEKWAWILREKNWNFKAKWKRVWQRLSNKDSCSETSLPKHVFRIWAEKQVPETCKRNE